MRSRDSTTVHSDCKIIEAIRKLPQEGKFFFRIEEKEWFELVRSLPSKKLSFLMLWCHANDVQILFLENGYRPIGIKVALSLNRYQAISPFLPAAIPYERMLVDFLGKEGMNAVDLRPWIDRGYWEYTWPWLDKPILSHAKNTNDNFEELSDSSKMKGQIDLKITSNDCDRALTPVWHLSLTNDKIIQAESLYGYTHRGILSSLRGKNISECIPSINRINALDNVAHQIAFSHAIEDMAGRVPSRPVLQGRIILLELSRMSAYLLYLSQLFEGLQVKLLSSRLEIARELLMRWCHDCFGHRWLMECIDFGCVKSVKPKHRQDLKRLPYKIKQLYDEAKALFQEFPDLVKRLEKIGILTYEQALQFNVGGVIGRASGRDLDIRRYADEYQLEWLPPCNGTGGDVLTRVRLYFHEIDNSLRIIDTLLYGLYGDDTFKNCKESFTEKNSGEGVGVCEGINGDLWYYVSVEKGKIDDIFIRDPATNQAFALQQIMKNTLWHDWDLIQSSFGILVTGVDF